ncbi:MAG: chlorate reductase subunit gamma [Rhodocyclales bacterium RIFCSPLOWO2_02_FULL_63_24]|nr:MAG: chlorate reductase subunit gamma [Rhodocyclales bacterium RIFCSPLOWO2_02_FULL_63_24]
MNPSNLLKQLAALGMAAATIGLTANTVQAAPASKTIRVLSAAGVDAASPEAAIWNKAPATQIALQAAFPGHGSIVGTPVTERITAQAVRAGDRLFVKLAWNDRNANTAIKDTGQFVDGAAVQFPVNGKADTTPFMGDPVNAVNVWHWRADGRTENLVAKGFGTSTRVPFEGLKGTAVRTNSGWAVVMSRSLKVKPDEGASLSGKGTMPVAFAAWDGDNQERDGLKAVTLEWWQLRF